MPTLRRSTLPRVLLATALAAAGLLTAGTAGAAPAASSTITNTNTVKATTVPVLTIKGSHPVFKTFTLVRPSTLEFSYPTGQARQVQVRGDGRLVGVVLRRIGNGNQPQVDVFTSNGCFTRACHPSGPAQLPFEVGSGDPRSEPRADGTYTVRLPAGRYNAILLADGAPATATIKLDGLAASKTLRPSTPVNADYYKITGATPEQPGHVYSTGGRTYTFGAWRWSSTPRPIAPPSAGRSWSAPAPSSGRRRPTTCTGRSARRWTPATTATMSSSSTGWARTSRPTPTRSGPWAG